MTMNRGDHGGSYEPDERTITPTNPPQPTAPSPLTPAEAAQRKLQARTQQAHENRRRVQERTFKDDARAAIYAKRSRDLEAESLEGRVLFGGGGRDDQMRLRTLKINQEFEQHHKHLLDDDVAYATANRIARERIDDQAHERLTPSEFAAVVANLTEQELASRGAPERSTSDASRYIEQLRHERAHGTGNVRGQRNWKG